ncbi:MAG TPA: chemotaxis protein CheW, partial [Anaeromyxobacter sp.]
MRVITFHVGSIECGLPIELVREILEPLPVTRVPGAAAALRGVTNVRGQVVPVLDVAIRIGAAADPAARSCLLVTDRGGAVCALAVDGVRGIDDLEPGRASAPPVVLQPAEWLAAIAERDGRVVLLVDLERLLDDAAIAASRAGPGRERAVPSRCGGASAAPVAGGAPARGGGEEGAVTLAHAVAGPAGPGIAPDAPYPGRATAAPGAAARAALRTRGRG